MVNIVSAISCKKVNYCAKIKFKKMKIQTVTISTLLVILFGCNNNKLENDLTNENLFGNVKSVREFSYVAIEKYGELTKGDRDRENNEKKDNELPNQHKQK